MRNLAAGSALLAIAAASAWVGMAASSHAGGETRTISMVHVHTGERLTVTYMKDGRYVPAAMTQINYVLRDWRRNKIISIDPRTIDLMWELHADLGSKVPIRIICGYRSAETNGMLKRIGRHVATQSQHTLGKAIDFEFPDVPLEKLRNSAIVRQVGGVGYYPGGQGGFVHLDSAHVRYWPRPSDSQLAQIFSTYRSTIGARMTNGTMLAQAEVPASAAKVTTGKPITVASAAPDEGDDDTAATKAVLTAMAGTRVTTAPDEAVPAPRSRPAGLAVIAAAEPVPTPRQAPADLRLAAAQADIEPAAAEPPPGTRNFAAQRPLAQGDSLGPVPAASTLVEEPTETNLASKGGLDMAALAALSAGDGSSSTFAASTRTVSGSAAAPGAAAASDLLSSLLSPFIGLVSFVQTPPAAPAVGPSYQVVPGADLRGMMTAAEADSSDLAAEGDGSAVSATKGDLQMINDGARADFERQASTGAIPADESVLTGAAKPIAFQ